MKDMKDQSEHRLEVELDNLEQCLAEDESMTTASYLDYQILRAAKSEIKRPKAKQVYHFNWFRRLSLPLYAAGSIAFTLFAINQMWHPPELQKAGNSEASTQVDFSQPSNSEAIEIPLKSRVKRELPQLILPPEEIASTPEATAQPLPVEQSQALFPQSEAQQSIFTGNQTEVKPYSEKQAWINKIVDYMQAGQLELARNEMVAFKKAYPEYPLEEQIKLFLP